MNTARKNYIKKFLLLWDEYSRVKVFPQKNELCGDFKYGVRMKEI